MNLFVNYETNQYTFLQDQNIIFLAQDDQSKLLAEAERQRILKVRKAHTVEKEEEKNKLRQEQKDYLNQKIINNEKKRAFKVKNRSF